MEHIKYEVIQHGLLWKVGFTYDSGLEISWTNDSDWEDKDKAYKHCELLNKSNT